MGIGQRMATTLGALMLIIGEVLCHGEESRLRKVACSICSEPSKGILEAVLDIDHQNVVGHVDQLLGGDQWGHGNKGFRL
jgi:hypothetical protein